MNAVSIPSVPWWRVGVMWLFVGGLGIVVMASVALMFTAVRHADSVLPQLAVRASAPTTPTAPAQQGRNHAATPR